MTMLPDAVTAVSEFAPSVCAPLNSILLLPLLKVTGEVHVLAAMVIAPVSEVEPIVMPAQPCELMCVRSAAVMPSVPAAPSTPMDVPMLAGNMVSVPVPLLARLALTVSGRLGPAWCLCTWRLLVQFVLVGSTCPVESNTQCAARRARST